MRELTCKVLDAMDQGLISSKVIAEAALNWLNEDEIADMIRANDLQDILNMEEEVYES